MNILRITMHVRPEKQKELMLTLLSLIKPSGKEKGCLSYAVFCDIGDKNIFNLISEWNTRNVMENHIKTDRFGVMLGTGSLLREPMNIQVHTVSDSEGSEMVNALRSKSTLILSL